MIILAVLYAVLTTALSAPPNEERIVGGFNIDIKKVPYQVSIQTPWGFHYCGGSLISENMVLTAAHCVDDDPRPQDVILYLGSTDRTQGGVAIQAANITYHQDYKAKPIKNDIALIKLSRSVEFSNKIKPIRLAAKDPSAGTTALATGWGKLHQDDPDTTLPKMLRGVYLKTISRRSCRAAYGASFIQNSNICAYTQDKDTCQGDSGGPLVANDLLIGIVSWGAGCARQGAPGVYTSVAGNLRWIAETSLNI